MLSLFSLQIINMFAPLLVLPFLTRTLGVDGFGQVMIIMSASAIGVLISDFGFNLSATYDISKNRENKSYVESVIGSVYVVKVLILLVLTLVVYATQLLLPEAYSNPNVVLLIVLNVLAQGFIPIWFFQGIEKMKFITYTILFSRVTYLILVFALIRPSSHYETVVVFLILSSIMASLVANVFVYRLGYRPRFSSFSNAARVFKESTQYFLSRAAVSVYTSASTLLVGSFAGATQAAFYSASEKLYLASQSVATPISHALFPHLASNGNTKLVGKVILYVGVPLSICCIFIGLLAPEILAFIFGQEFAQSADVLRVFLVLTVVNFISVNMGYPVFAALGKVSVANYTVIAGAVVQLVCLTALYLLGELSARNVAVSVLITESTVLTLRVMAYRYFKGKLCIS